MSNNCHKVLSAQENKGSGNACLRKLIGWIVGAKRGAGEGKTGWPCCSHVRNALRSEICLKHGCMKVLCGKCFDLETRMFCSILMLGTVDVKGCKLWKAISACTLVFSAPGATGAMLAGGGVENWLTSTLQIEVHCLQIRSTSWTKKAENPG